MGTRRLIYSLSAGVLAVALAAGGAMLISGGKDSSESPYLSMNETPAQIVISETEEAGATCTCGDRIFCGACAAGDCAGCGSFHSGSRGDGRD